MKILALAKSLELVRKQPIPGGEGYILRTSENMLVLASSSILDDPVEGRKWKLGVSLESGCQVGCTYCFTNNLKQHRKLTAEEIVEQVELIRSNFDPGPVDQVKVEFKEMGDPATNSHHTCRAIEILSHHYPHYLFVVSTSGVRNLKMFKLLKQVRSRGAQIRLQFSCHTTDNDERFKLSPKLKMMSLEEIASVVSDWYDGSSRATLTFVPFKDFTYDANRIAELFQPKEVFIKISYVDFTRAAKKAGLSNEDPAKVAAFVEELRDLKFTVAHRNQLK